MKKLLLFLIFLVLGKSVSAQDIITSRQSSISTSIKKKLDSKFKSYQILTLSNLPSLKDNMTFELQTLNSIWKVELYLNDIRAKDFKIQEFSDKNVSREIINKCSTFSGIVNGDNARFYITDKLLSATIYQKEDILILEPLSWVLGTTDIPEVWILYRDSERINETNGECGIKSSKDLTKSVTSNLQAQSYSTLNCKILNVAIEYDYEFHSMYGGYNQIISIMNNVDYIYYQDIGNRVNISWIEGWTTSNDPYSSTNIDGNLLGEFTSYWQNNRSNISRNLAHMFTGRELGNGFPGINSNGMANLVNICSGSNSYSLSDRGAGGSDWEYVACHEIAHNLGHPGHDSDFGINCSATRYIMCSGDGKNGNFSSNSEGIISNFLNNISCMSNGNTPPIRCTLDGIPINSTPFYTSSGGHYLYVIDNSSPQFPSPTITSYNYSPSNGSVIYYPNGSNCYFNNNGVNYFNMQIVVNNICGATYRTIPFIINSNYKISPNPAKDILTVEFELDSQDESYQALPVEIFLRNENGLNLKVANPQEMYRSKTLTSKSNKVTLDVKNLLRGTYYLHLNYPDERVDKVKIILE